MNEYFILAFIVTPALVVLLGYVAVRVHEHVLDKERRETK